MKFISVTLAIFLLWGCGASPKTANQSEPEEKKPEYVEKLIASAKSSDRSALLKINEIAGDDGKYGVANREIAQDALSFLLCNSPEFWMESFSEIPESEVHWKGFVLDDLPQGMKSEADCKSKILKELQHSKKSLGSSLRIRIQKEFQK